MTDLNGKDPLFEAQEVRSKEQPPTQTFLGYQNYNELRERALTSGLSEVEADEYASLATMRCIDADKEIFRRHDELRALIR